MKIKKIALLSVGFILLFNICSGKGFTQILLKDIRYEISEEKPEPIVIAENKTEERDKKKRKGRRNRMSLKKGLLRKKNKKQSEALGRV